MGLQSLKAVALAIIHGMVTKGHDLVAVPVYHQAKLNTPPVDQNREIIPTALSNDTAEPTHYF